MMMIREIRGSIKGLVGYNRPSGLCLPTPNFPYVSSHVSIRLLLLLPNHALKRHILLSFAPETFHVRKILTSHSSSEDCNHGAFEGGFDGLSRGPSLGAQLRIGGGC